MNFEEFNQKMINTCKKIQINLCDDEVKYFFDYMNLIIEKNNVINLTSIIEPDEIILKHFIDSLTVSKYIKNNEKIIDVGTGAGFPGIPLKIEKKNREIMLLDSLNKRINFLEEVIKKLQLKNIYAEHARAEDAGKNIKYREKFDIAISRAVAPLNILVEYLIPFVKIGGKCICMKGNYNKEEINEAENAIKILGAEISKVEKIVLPDSNYNRTIIIIEKKEKTKEKYPRKAGEPKKHPL